MKYLIVSDIHGCFPTLQQVLSYYDSASCDMLLILGDILNYGPRNGLPEGLNPKLIAETLNAMADKIVAIRGNCDSEVDQMLLDFPIMADYALVVDNGRRLLLTHGHKYNKENMLPGKYDVVFSGHTHLWTLENEEDTVFCNTGSITFPKGGNVPTFAIYEDGVVEIHHLNGKLLKSFGL